MKKILLMLLVFGATQLTAQNKEKEKLEKKLEKSDAEIADAKKNVDPKTWLNRATLFMDIYELPVKNVMIGMPQLQIKTVLKDEKSRTDNIELDSVSYEILRYPDKDLYFNPAGLLAFWQLKDLAADEPLIKAYGAYSKAYELDAKQSNAKKIREGLELLSLKLNTEAATAYTLEKYDAALRYFETSLQCTTHPAVNTIDTLIIYNVAFLARLVNENDKALNYFKQLIGLGYEAEGNVNANYAALLQEKGDSLQAKDVLAQAFLKYPKNQQILVLLINAGSDMTTIFRYLKQAQENEPHNASLYDKEGNIYDEQLNDKEKAMQCYMKAIEVNPDYFPAHYHIGVLHYNKAISIQDAASKEPDDAKYTALLKELDTELKAALPYFVRAYELYPEELSTVQFLKNICYRFREQSPEMMADFERYSKILEEAQ
ncbi:MAG: tetratricopeptide repeat protein [Prevotellaceae bacterium]|nr:tetratricopeptide repeat protein [Prevotellaceae bacterium]